MYIGFLYFLKFMFFLLLNIDLNKYFLIILLYLLYFFMYFFFIFKFIIW